MGGGGAPSASFSNLGVPSRRMTQKGPGTSLRPRLMVDVELLFLGP